MSVTEADIEAYFGAAGPVSRALGKAAVERLPVPIRETLDADTTAEPFLPFLAAADRVVFWNQDWPLERRRRIVKQWPRLGALIGTRDAAEAFLAFVDAEQVHKVSYPAKFPIGRIAAGITPVNHPPLTTRFLVKVALVAPIRAACAGRTAIGRASLRTVDFGPVRWARQALAVSKAQDKAYSVTFAHRVPVDLDTGFDLDAGLQLGAYQDRHRL